MSVYQSSPNAAPDSGLIILWRGVGADRPTRMLMSRSAPDDRLLMTYLEMSAMNDRFLEAEAVPIADVGDGWPLGAYAHRHE